MAAFQDFLALVGLPPMAVDGLEGGEGEALPGETEAALPGMTGNFLPPALPVLPPLLPPLLPPPLPDLAAQGEQLPQGAQGLSAGLHSGAPGQAAPTMLPMPGEGPARQPAVTSASPSAVAPALGQASAMRNPAMPQPALLHPTLADAASSDPASSTVTTRATTEPRMARLQVDLVALPQAAPAAPQPQLSAAQPMPQHVPQAVLAQLLQAQTRPGDVRADGRAQAGEAALRAPAAVAAVDPDMAQEAESLRPVAAPAAAQPVPPTTTQAPVAQPIVAAVDSAAPALSTSASPAAEAAAPRHDFTAVVEKLAEARELARPGRAEMHMAHREFGQISVRFDLAGDALKVALSSPDAAFAPAVQAALAERPLAALADAARAEAAPQRVDVAPTVTGAQVGPQADGQRGDAHQRSGAARASTDQVQRQREGDEGASRQSSPGSDGSLFA